MNSNIKNDKTPTVSRVDDMRIISEITKRAEKVNLLAFDRLSLMMDIECAHKEFNLRLNDLLNADEFNFAHDIIGIQNNIDRKNVKMANCFVPRFTTPK